MIPETKKNARKLPSRLLGPPDEFSSLDAVHEPDETKRAKSTRDDGFLSAVPRGSFNKFAQSSSAHNLNDDEETANTLASKQAQLAVPSGGNGSTTFQSQSNSRSSSPSNEGWMPSVRCVSRRVSTPNANQTRVAASLQMLQKPSFLVRLVNHAAFNVFSGLLLLLNTAFLGIEANYTSQHKGATAYSFDVARHVFCGLFLTELLLRMAALKSQFLFNRDDRTWNIFDVFMVSLGLLELALTYIESGNGGASTTGRMVRVMRLVRLTRAVRIGRFIRYVRTVQQIVYALSSSVGTLFWAMVMVFLVLYCFSIVFVQGSTDALLEYSDWGLDDCEAARGLRTNFGSLSSSVYSLFMAMTGGKNWGEVVRPLFEISSVYGALFLVFISMCYFGLLNVVTAIFVDSAMQSQQHYKDLMIQENALKKEVYSEHLKELFHKIDIDGSGCINGDEMEFVLSDQNLFEYLDSMDIFANDARTLFSLLDYQDRGVVNIDEFCEGCLRLKGEAKAFDIHFMIYNNERSQRRLDEIVDRLSILLDQLEVQELI